MSPVMIRCNAKEARDMLMAGTLTPWLRGLGLETRTMRCRIDGEDLVYEGVSVTKYDDRDHK